MIMKKDNGLYNFIIETSNQYFEIIAIKISYNKIVINQRDAGLYTENSDGEHEYRSYFSFDWGNDTSKVSRWYDEIIYESIYDYIIDNDTSNTSEFFTNICKTFQNICQFMYFYYLDFSGNIYCIGNLDYHKNIFHPNK